MYNEDNIVSWMIVGWLEICQKILKTWYSDCVAGFGAAALLLWLPPGDCGAYWEMTACCQLSSCHLISLSFQQDHFRMMGYGWHGCRCVECTVCCRIGSSCCLLPTSLLFFFNFIDVLPLIMHAHFVLRSVCLKIVQTRRCLNFEIFVPECKYGRSGS